jgi:hypothetical protein
VGRLKLTTQILGLRHTKIIYVESFARVKSLSLSAKLLRHVVDTFIVQWPEAAGPGSVVVPPFSATRIHERAGITSVDVDEMNAGPRKIDRRDKEDLRIGRQGGEAGRIGNVVYRGWLV